MNDKVLSWLNSADLEELTEQGQNRGIIYFYNRLCEAVKEKDGLSSYPTSRNVLAPGFLSNELESPRERMLLRNKVVFFIDFLKKEGYLEVIPLLRKSPEGNIYCEDHLIVNTQNDESELPIAPFVEESLGLCAAFSHELFADYSVNIYKVYEDIEKEDPLYIRYLPYYHLMNKFRSDIDPLEFNEEERFSTIRRDKQQFLNKLYQKLLEIKVLSYEADIPELNKLNHFFHFAWLRNPKSNIPNMDAHRKLFQSFLEKHLLNEDSRFFHENFHNDKLTTLVQTCRHTLQKEKEDKADKSTPYPINLIFRLCCTIMSEYQHILFRHPITHEKDAEVRYVRNSLVEMAFHRKSILNFYYITEQTEGDPDIVSYVGIIADNICLNLKKLVPGNNHKAQVNIIEKISSFPQIRCLEYISKAPGEPPEVVKLAFHIINFKKFLLYIQGKLLRNRAIRIHLALERLMSILKYPAENPPAPLTADMYNIHMDNCRILYDNYQSGQNGTNTQSETVDPEIVRSFIQEFVKDEDRLIDIIDRKMPRDSHHMHTGVKLEHIDTTEKRDSGNLASEHARLEKLKKTLTNPANYNVFFNGSRHFKEAAHPISELREKYAAYKKHFHILFPKMAAMVTELKQLKALMNSFVRVGLAVQVVISDNAAKSMNLESVFYVETSFWQDETSRRALAEEYRDQFKACQDQEKSRFYDEWIHYLDLTAKMANKRSRKLFPRV